MATSDYDNFFDAWDDQFFNERDDDRPSKEVACRHCGSTNVYWSKDADDRWVLYDLNSRKHRCKTEVSYTDAFDTL